MPLRIHATIPLVILLAVMSGLFIFSRIAGPYEQETVTATVEPVFDGRVLPEIVRGDTTKKQVIFTFDAGSGDASLQNILTTLTKHSVKGTFFVTGKWAMQYPELVRQMSALGHEVFNHSYDHPYLTTLSDTDISSQLVTTDTLLTKSTGSSTRPYFRPPYGDRDARVLKIAAQNGYRSVFWTVDAQDWRESDGITAYDVKKIVLSNLQPGMIVLMHVGDTITGMILDELFTEIQSRGYTIVSLTQGI